MRFSIRLISTLLILMVFTRMASADESPRVCASLPTVTGDLVTPFETEDQYLGGDITTVGLAKAVDDGAQLYCEAYFKINNQKVRVDYYWDGELYVRKLLDFSRSNIAPSSYQYDLRSGEQRVSTYSEQGIQSEYQKDRDSKVKRSDPVTDVVVDAGFNNFVVNQWQLTSSGEKVEFDFLSPVHAKTVELQLIKSSSENCGSQDEQKGLTCFTVTINNAFLKLFFGELKLTYDMQRRLVTFEGAVNILDEKGKSQKARIDYVYPNAKSL